MTYVIPVHAELHGKQFSIWRGSTFLAEGYLTNFTGHIGIHVTSVRGGIMNATDALLDFFKDEVRKELEREAREA